jgi:hypothetical protein
VLTYQYAKRRTFNSRVAFIVIVVLFVVLLYGFSCAHFGSPVRAMISNQYPTSSEASLRLVMLSKPVPYGDRDVDMRVPRGFVEVKLPVRLEGLPSEYKLHDANISYTIDAEGFQYTSPWQPANVGLDVTSFLMPKKISERVAARNVHLYLELLGERLRPGTSHDIPATARFNVPQNGRCVLNRGGLTCGYAFRMLVPTRIEAVSGGPGCEATGSNRPSYAALRVIPDGGRADPIVEQEVHFENKICPGSRLTFSEYLPAGKFRVGLDLSSIDVAEYKARQD